MVRTDGEGRAQGLLTACTVHMEHQRMTGRDGSTVLWPALLCHFLRRGGGSKEMLTVKGMKLSYGHVRLAKGSGRLVVQAQSSGKRRRLEIKLGNDRDDDSAIT